MNQIMKFTFFCMMLITPSMLFGQSNTVSSGGQASGSGGSISYTIGQPLYTVASMNNGVVTQGIQHPFEIMVITSLTENRIELSTFLYPNPTTQGIMLETQNPIEEELSFVLYDFNGRILLEKLVLENQVYIPLDKQTIGQYFLKVKGRNDQVKIFKVIKK